MSDLIVHLDTPLPQELAVGAGTAVFVAGWCAPRVDDLRLVVDGSEQALDAFGMPRLDVARALGERADAYRSGFWGLARIGPRAGASASPVRVALRARVGGRDVEHPLGEIAVAGLPEPVEGSPRVAICMATHDPPPDLLRAQLDSIRAQTVSDWVCVISDDQSSAPRYEDLLAAVGDDPRFVVSRAPRRLGFYRNFERALALAPTDAPFVALADQDDRWHPDKLEVLLGAIGDAPLVYSDARVVAPDGRVLADTWWATRANNHSDPLSLLVANSVTGAASLLRRELLEIALPFPPGQFAHFHDHWLGLAALAVGDIAYVDRPLYDYVQHGSAVLGHEAATRMVGLGDRLARLRHADPRERVRKWRLHYFVDVARLRQFAAVALLRAGERMPRRRRRVLEAFVAGDRSPLLLARLWARGAREMGRRRPETLGAEWMLAYALTWRRMLGAAANRPPDSRLRLDALPPPNLALAPGKTELSGPAKKMAEKIAPLAWAVRDDAPERINVLIPTIDLAHLFGGYIGKFNLARRLAERGRRVRIVTVDPVGALPPDWRAQVAAYEGLGDVFDRVEVAFGRETPGGVETSRSDRFVATTWWTAHIAAAAGTETDGRGFLYLIQEYEPLTFPHGTWYALAEQSYAFPHVALYSTELLREYFVEQGIGDADGLAFENAITPVQPPADLATRETRRLLFYARPEAHAARNLFELGCLALARVAAQGGLAGWELRGVGTTALGRVVDLGAGARLELLPRTPQGEYARLLGEHDVGLALMHTPHPSLVPLEMASAGMTVVTSTYANKTAEKLGAISTNILGAPPTAGGVASALSRAIALADDTEGRLAGSRVRWSRDWRDSFSDELLDRLLERLG